MHKCTGQSTNKIDKSTNEVTEACTNAQEHRPVDLSY